MADIRINQLPVGGGPVATDFLPIDNGTTRKATIQSVVEIGRPAASQAEAEAGTDPTKAMTPLTTKQAVEFYGLTKAGNLSGITNAPLARTNLGLGSAAVESAAFFAQVANNLSDLTNDGAARFNISVPVHVADKAAIKALDPTQDLASILRLVPEQGTFYPRLISSLAAATVTAMGNDVTELIYITSTQNPAYVWIREGAELRGFWSNSATPAYVHRLRERVMIGDSAGFDASTTPDTNTGAAWLHTIKPGATNSNGYMETHGRVVSTGANGMQFVGATRITGAASVEGYGAIFHVRNESTNDRDCWGVYIDTVRQSATAGNMAGVELDIANCSGVDDASFLPYGFSGTPPTAWSYGMSIASGGDITVNPDALPVSHALTIINNGSTFNTGIVFRSDALVLTGGFARAITMATQHKISWYTSDNNEASILTSTAATAAAGTRQYYIDNGLELRRNGNDQVYFRSLTSSTAVNFFEIVATATGSAPIIRSAGADTNLNVVLQPKGTGVLQVTYAATTTADIASNRRVRIRVAGADIDLLGVLV